MNKGIPSAYVAHYLSRNCGDDIITCITKATSTSSIPKPPFVAVQQDNKKLFKTVLLLHVEQLLEQITPTKHLLRVRTNHMLRGY